MMEPNADSGAAKCPRLPSSGTKDESHEAVGEAMECGGETTAAGSIAEPAHLGEPEGGVTGKAEGEKKALAGPPCESDLRRALRCDEFCVHYQPQINLQTERLVGMEALIRWKHPGLGLVAPGQFIPLAEDTGLILPIGEWVLRRACRQNREWQMAGFPPLRVSVNLSSRQFDQEDLARTVARVLAETELSPRYLELELTESAVMTDPAHSIATLHRLRGMGIKVSVDDFGSGYSSLSYLKHLPVDILKIDQSFIHDLLRDSRDRAIVRAIIGLAHDLQLQVTAEGVQTAGQVKFLRELKCDKAQGYLYNTPLPAAIFQQQLLEKQPRVAAA